MLLCHIDNGAGYDAIGHLIGSSSGAQLAYDALGRLSYTAVSSAGITRFGYAGDQMIAEYDAGGNLVRRHTRHRHWRSVC